MGRPRKYANTGERMKAYRLRQLSDDQQQVLIALVCVGPLGSIHRSVVDALLKRGLIQRVPMGFEPRFRAPYIPTADGLNLAVEIMQAGKRHTYPGLDRAF